MPASFGYATRVHRPPSHPPQPHPHVPRPGTFGGPANDAVAPWAAGQTDRRPPPRNPADANENATGSPARTAGRAENVIAGNVPRTNRSAWAGDSFLASSAACSRSPWAGSHGRAGSAWRASRWSWSRDSPAASSRPSAYRPSHAASARSANGPGLPSAWAATHPSGALAQYHLAHSNGRARCANQTADATSSAARAAVVARERTRRAVTTARRPARSAPHSLHRPDPAGRADTS